MATADGAHLVNEDYSQESRDTPRTTLDPSYRSLRSSRDWMTPRGAVGDRHGGHGPEVI